MCGAGADRCCSLLTGVGSAGRQFALLVVDRMIAATIRRAAGLQPSIRVHWLRALNHHPALLPTASVPIVSTTCKDDAQRVTEGKSGWLRSAGVHVCTRVGASSPAFASDCICSLPLQKAFRGIESPIVFISSIHHGLFFCGLFHHNRGLCTPTFHSSRGDAIIAATEAATAGEQVATPASVLTSAARASGGRQRRRISGGGVQGQPHRPALHSAVPCGVRPAGRLAVATQVGESAPYNSQHPMAASTGVPAPCALRPSRVQSAASLAPALRSWTDGPETFRGMVEVSRALMRGRDASQQRDAVIKGFPEVRAAGAAARRASCAAS